MADQAILESLDDLWFFSNVFASSLSSPSPPLPFSSCGVSNTDQPHLKEAPRTEQPKPRSPTILKLKQPILSPNSAVLVEVRSQSKDLTPETRMRIMKSPVVGGFESSSESPRRERKSGKERKCCVSSMNRRKNHRLQEVIELGSSHREVSVVPGLRRMERTYGFEKCENLNQMKMPPLSDGMAMKEHLKSWAYAVACTVK